MRRLLLLTTGWRRSPGFRAVSLHARRSFVAVRFDLPLPPRFHGGRRSAPQSRPRLPPRLPDGRGDRSRDPQPQRDQEGADRTHALIDIAPATFCRPAWSRRSHGAIMARGNYEYPSDNRCIGPLGPCRERGRRVSAALGDRKRESDRGRSRSCRRGKPRARVHGDSARVHHGAATHSHSLLMKMANPYATWGHHDFQSARRSRVIAVNSKAFAGRAPAAVMAICGNYRGSRRESGLWDPSSSVVSL